MDPPIPFFSLIDLRGIQMFLSLFICVEKRSGCDKLTNHLIATIVVLDFPWKLRRLVLSPSILLIDSCSC